MTKDDVKEMIFGLVISVINFAIAYFITYSLGIQNITIHHGITMLTTSITYEVVIFMMLSLVEATFYHFKFEEDF